MRYDFNLLTEEENDLLYNILVGFMDFLCADIEEGLNDVKEKQEFFNKIVDLHRKIEIKEMREKENEM